MRKSLLLTVMLMAVLVLVVGCPNKPPKTPARPMGEANPALGDTESYRSVTTDPNRDKIRYAFNWGDGTKEDTSALQTSGDTVTLAHVWSTAGVFPVKVKAGDEKGKWCADWSDTLIVTIDTGGQVNHPPDAPLKPTHTGAAWVDSVQYFATSATDPDGDSVQIKWYLDEGQVHDFGAKVASGAQVTDSVWYHNKGIKVIRAVAMDVHGDTSTWSDSLTLFIDAPNAPPYHPTILHNRNAKRGIAGGPAYRFYATARHPYGDSIRYRFYFDDNDSVTSGLFAAGGDGFVTWVPTGDTHTWTVKVRAIAAGGLTNDTIPSDTFRVVNEGTVIWGLDDEFYASPAMGSAMYQGNAYPAVVCGSREGYLYVVDAYQSFINSLLTMADADEYHSSATIANDGSFYVGNENGAFYAFAQACTLKWRFGNLDTGLSMSATAALASGGAIFCGGEDKQLHKLTDNGGSVTEVWAKTLRNELTSSPAVMGNGNVVCSDDSGWVYCFQDDGTPVWEYRTGDSIGISSSPAVTSDGTVYVGTELGRLLAIKDGNLLWDYTISVSPRIALSSSPVIGSDGNIYFTADDGKLYRIDQNTHLPVANWPITVSGAAISCTPLLCADGVVYVTSDDDSLYAYNISDATQKWVTFLGAPPPKKGQSPHPRPFTFDQHPSAMVDQYGIIYVSTSNGLFAIAGRLAGTLAQTDWPMFHHDAKHTGRFGW
jgi:outer membrane protein assembly factor BamB